MVSISKRCSKDTSQGTFVAKMADGSVTQPKQRALAVNAGKTLSHNVETVNDVINARLLRWSSTQE